MTTASPLGSTRLVSLDQFRGYTMFGMLLVNFLGGYAVCPKILKHSHDYCSYADTIMPQFLFAAGFAMRLSIRKRMEKGGTLPWGRITRRVLGLALVAIVWYSFCDWSGVVKRLQNDGLLDTLAYQTKRGWFQTLMHIAITSLWIVPVIARSAKVRFAYAAVSALLHIGLSWWFNFHWVNTGANGIDGGPFGFLTWCVPAIFGTWAADLVLNRGIAATARLVLVGIVVMGAAWLMSCPTVLYNRPPTAEKLAAEQLEKLEKLAPDPVIPNSERLKRWSGEVAEPPFVPPPGKQDREWNYWMMSQRSGSLTYTLFAAGFSLVIYAAFLQLCDGFGWTLGLFRTLGVNSLAAYLLHDVAGWTVAPWFPEDSSSVGLTLLGFFCFTLAVYLPCRMLEAKGWLLRV